MDNLKLRISSIENKINFFDKKLQKMKTGCLKLKKCSKIWKKACRIYKLKCNKLQKIKQNFNMTCSKIY